MNKRAIVITTINPPTSAVSRIAARFEGEAKIIVIGDRKTPSQWAHDSVRYVSVEEQRDLFPDFSDAIPYNHYCRKNIGYLLAIEGGANEILETDDDNLPYNDFGVVGSAPNKLITGTKYCNIYSWFTDRMIWPRGLPLDEIGSRGEISSNKFAGNVGIVQWLADEDPDVDAIYRLTSRDRVIFERDRSYVLDKGVWCPFNSQNTLFRRVAFDALYLPCFVSFRMTDIWRSFVAQRLLWEKGFNLQFSSSTVAQERNPHDLMRDFRDEIIGYVENKKIIDIISAEKLDNLSEIERPIAIYRSLHAAGIVPDKELRPLELFLEKISEYA